MVCKAVDCKRSVKSKYTPYCTIKCARADKFSDLTSNQIDNYIRNFWCKDGKEPAKVYHKLAIEPPTTQSSESKEEDTLLSKCPDQRLYINRIYPNPKKITINPHTKSGQRAVERLLDEYTKDKRKWGITSMEPKDADMLRGFFLDFDLAFESFHPQINSSKITSLCKYISGVINTCLYNLSSYHIFVCRRPLRVSAEDGKSLVLSFSEKKGYYKDGLHIYIPELLANRYIRENIVYILQEGIIRWFSEADVELLSMDMPDAKSSILDAKPIVNGSHFLYGSDKDIKCEPDYHYKLEAHFIVDPNKDKMSCRLSNTSKSKINLVPEIDCSYWGIEKLTKPRLVQLSKIGITSVDRIRDRISERKALELERAQKYRPSEAEIKLVREKESDVLDLVRWILMDVVDVKRSREGKLWRYVLGLVRGIYTMYWVDLGDPYEVYETYDMFDSFAEPIEQKLFAILDKFSKRAEPTGQYVDTEDVYEKYLYSWGKAVATGSGEIIPDNRNMRSIQSLWYLLGKRDSPELHTEFWKRYYKIIPRNTSRKRLELNVFSDYKKLTGKSLSLKEFKEWTDKCFRIVDNSGRQFEYYVLNYCEDKRTQYLSKQWYQTTSGSIQSILTRNFYLENPDYLPCHSKSRKYLNYGLTATIGTAIRYMRDNGLIKTYDGAEFIPYLHKPEKKENERYSVLNTFGGFAIKNIMDERGIHLQKPEEMKYNMPTEQCESISFEESPIYTHIKKYICAGDPELLEYYLNWIADIIQNPARNPEVALVLISKQGIGKDFMAKFIADLIGHRYHADVDASTFFNKFNSILQDKMLVTINEIKEGGKQQEYFNKLKKIICQQDLNLEKKGIDMMLVRWFARLVFHSNNFSVVKVENSDRRFVVFHCDNSILEDQAKKVKYFNNLWGFTQTKQYKEEWLINAFKYFAERDISNWQPRVLPENSKFKSEHILDSLSSPIRFIYDLADDIDIIKQASNRAERRILIREKPNNNIVIKASELFPLYASYCAESKHPAKKRHNFHNELLEELDIPKTSNVKRITISENDRDRYYIFNIEDLQNKFRKIIKDKNLVFKKNEDKDEIISIPYKTPEISELRKYQRVE